MHKRGLDDPMTTESGCSASECHGEELTGGLGVVDDKLVSVPSCYQCHGKKWDDNSDDDDSILASFSLPSGQPATVKTFQTIETLK